MRIALACLLGGLTIASAAMAQEKQITLPADNDYATLKPGPHRERWRTGSGIESDTARHGPGTKLRHEIVEPQAVVRHCHPDRRIAQRGSRSRG